MTLNIALPDGQTNLRPKITVIGVGGAGGNAVNNMINSNLEGVDFLVANTDAQALENSLCEKKVQLGLESTEGLGAGMRPDIGKISAEESKKDIESKLSGSNMAFIAAGMGGGTGTGAAPIVAKIARERGILTVGVVTKPFDFEGMQRLRIANSGIDELEQYVDTLIVIPNQNLFRIANEKTTFSDAFKMADDVLYAGVRGVTDLMVMPGLINLDFSDVKTVMSEMGKAMMGTGQAEGEKRAVDAAEKAIANPLIDDVSLKGAKGLIINITGGQDLTLYEVDEAANRIREEVDSEANIIFGSTTDDRLEGVMRVSIVATGIQSNSNTSSKPMVSNYTKIDNSVYGKPSSNLNLSKTNDYNLARKEEIVNEKTNPISEEKLMVNEYTSNSNNLEMEPSFQSSNENILNEEDVTYKTEENKPDTLIETGELNKSIETNEEVNSSAIKPNGNLEDQDKETLSAQIEEDQTIKKTTSSRLSLFDNFEDSKIPLKKESEKKEPMLNISDNESDGIDMLEDEFNQDLESDSDEIGTKSDEIEEDGDNKDDELLDIPTFLRRQAN